MMRPHRPRTSALPALVVVMLAGGCETPIGDTAEGDLRRSVMDTARREIAEAQTYPGTMTTRRTESVKALGINPSLMDELGRMAGPNAYEGRPLPVGERLIDKPTPIRRISLERAVRTAVENNLGVQFARLSPAISQAQVASAQAAFDWTFFTNLNLNDLNEPQIGSSFSSVNSTQQQQVQSQSGLRRPLTTGGQLTVQQQLDYTDNSTPGLTANPNPAGTAAISLQIDQPLLRGWGSDVALAEVRINRNAERTAIAALRRDLTKAVTDTEKTYWQLVKAHRDLLILQRLLERGIETRDTVRGREQLDATPSQIASANARVERRRADVLRAQTALHQISDRLKALVNDSDTPVGSEALLIPADDAVDAPFSFSTLDLLRTAITERPEIEQAVLSIDDTSIRRIVADNARLPRLDFRFQTKFSALEQNLLSAYGQVFDGNFVDYVVGLAFEQPIGNRKAEAEFRRRTLERQQAVISYRNTVQQILVELLSALRNVSAQYQLIEQTRAARFAAAEDLRAQVVERTTTKGFTVERLNLELNTQEQLANAERDEAAALADYNSSLADLYAAIGRTLQRNRIDFKVPSPAEAADARPPARPADAGPPPGG